MSDDLFKLSPEVEGALFPGGEDDLARLSATALNLENQRNRLKSANKELSKQLNEVQELADRKTGEILELRTQLQQAHEKIRQLMDDSRRRQQLETDEDGFLPRLGRNLR